VSEARVIFADQEIERRRGYDRRELSFRTFMQGGLTPRRRCGRRSDENHALVDWHEPHLLFMALMILLLSVTDAFLTLTLISHGATEANPILAYVLSDHPDLFALVKLLLTSVSILVLVALARARVFRVIRVTSVMQSCLVLYLALICYEWWMLEAIL